MATHIYTPIKASVNTDWTTQMGIKTFFDHSVLLKDAILEEVKPFNTNYSMKAVYV